jgi:hypothetical protein
VLASGHDLAAAANAADNIELYRHLVAMEAVSTFSFQPERWLADVAPHLLAPSLNRDIVVAKRQAAARREIEAAMAPGLRFVKGWPPRLPTIEEAGSIALARTQLLERHGLQNHFPDASAILRRFADLLDAKASRSTARM